MGVREKLMGQFEPVPKPDAVERQEEARKVRRLQIMVNMVMSVIAQDPDLTLEQATDMVTDARRAALAMFPDKELAWNILYRPRLYRLLNERYHLQ
jgi:hypothetical protein